MARYSHASRPVRYGRVVSGGLGASGKLDQTITNFLPTNGSVFVSTDAVGLSAQASSGLAVTFAVGSGPGSIADGANLSFSGLGEVSIVALQAGDADWNTAPDATNTFTVTASVSPVVSSTNVNARGAGEGRFFVTLDQAPGAETTVTVARVSGDTNITVKSGTELVFTPAAWTNWLAVTLGAGADAANGTATFEVTMPGAATQTVVATELDIDLGANLALASGGSAIAGPGTVRPGDLTDGIHTSKANCGYTVWTIVPPKTMTLDLKVQTALSRIRLLNWDWQLRDQFYTIESSPDNATWTTVADASTGVRRGWEDWGVSSTGRYLRFTGLSNSVKDRVYVAEWEVYGTRVVRAKGMKPDSIQPRMVKQTQPARASSRPRRAVR